MPTLLMQRAGARHVVVVHRPVPIDDAEWTQLVDVLESIAREKGGVFVLVRSSEGGPDAGQRAEVNERFAKLKLRVAVLTNSRITRGIVMALSWFKVVDIKAVAPTELDRALDFLETDQGERDEVVATLRELEKRLELSVVA